MSLMVVLRHSMCVVTQLYPAYPANLTMSLYAGMPSCIRQSYLLQISISSLPCLPFHCSHFGSSKLTHPCLHCTRLPVISVHGVLGIVVCMFLCCSLCFGSWCTGVVCCVVPVSLLSLVLCVVAGCSGICWLSVGDCYMSL